MGRLWRPARDRQVPPTAPNEKGQFGGRSDLERDASAIFTVWRNAARRRRAVLVRWRQTLLAVGQAPEHRLDSIKARGEIVEASVDPRLAALFFPRFRLFVLAL